MHFNDEILSSFTTGNDSLISTCTLFMLCSDMTIYIYNTFCEQHQFNFLTPSSVNNYIFLLHILFLLSLYFAQQSFVYIQQSFVYIQQSFVYIQQVDTFWACAMLVINFVTTLYDVTMAVYDVIVTSYDIEV